MLVYTAALKTLNRDWDTLAMEALGHSTIAVTMKTYSAVIPALRKEVASQIEAAFGPVATCVATQDTDTAQTEMPS